MVPSSLDSHIALASLLAVIPWFSVGRRKGLIDDLPFPMLDGDGAAVEYAGGVMARHEPAANDMFRCDPPSCWETKSKRPRGVIVTSSAQAYISPFSLRSVLMHQYRFPRPLGPCSSAILPLLYSAQSAG